MGTRMRTRCLLVLALTSFALPVAASFDLMLIPSGSQVRRYDPDTNVNLGGVNIPNTNYAVADQANNRVFVSDTATGSLRAYDYNTGAVAGVWGMNAVVQHMAYHAASNSMFYTTPSGSVARYRLSDGSTQFLALPASVSARSLTVFGDSVVAMGTNTSSVLTHMAWNASTLVMTDTYSYGTTVLFPGSLMGKSLVLAGSGPFFDYRLAYRDAGGNMVLGRYQVAANGFLSTWFAPVSLPSYSNAVAPSVVRGHNGYFLVGADVSAANTLRVEEFSNSGILLRQNVVSGYSLNGVNFGADNVVAPEPGTLAALALGGAALLRRKRKKSA